MYINDDLIPSKKNGNGEERDPTYSNRFSSVLPDVSALCVVCPVQGTSVPGQRLTCHWARREGAADPKLEPGESLGRPAATECPPGASLQSVVSMICSE